MLRAACQYCESDGFAGAFAMCTQSGHDAGRRFAHFVIRPGRIHSLRAQHVRPSSRRRCRKTRPHQRPPPAPLAVAELASAEAARCWLPSSRAGIHGPVAALGLGTEKRHSPCFVFSKCRDPAGKRRTYERTHCGRPADGRPVDGKGKARRSARATWLAALSYVATSSHSAAGASDGDANDLKSRSAVAVVARPGEEPPLVRPAPRDQARSTDRRPARPLIEVNPAAVGDAPAHQPTTQREPLSQ